MTTQCQHNMLFSEVDLSTNERTTVCGDCKKKLGPDDFPWPPPGTTISLPEPVTADSYIFHDGNYKKPAL